MVYDRFFRARQASLSGLRDSAGILDSYDGDVAFCSRYRCPPRVSCSLVVVKAASRDAAFCAECSPLRLWPRCGAQCTLLNCPVVCDQHPRCLWSGPRKSPILTCVSAVPCILIVCSRHDDLRLGLCTWRTMVLPRICVSLSVASVSCDNPMLMGRRSGEMKGEG